MRNCRVSTLGCTFSRAVNQEYPRKCVYCGEVQEEDPKKALSINEEWNQYFYFRGKQLVCGVRLYECDSDWQEDHPGFTFVKKINHIVEVIK